jgi:hypothetical protein
LTDNASLAREYERLRNLKDNAMPININISVDFSPRQKRLVRAALVTGGIMGALGLGIVVAAPKHTFTAGTPVSAGQMNDNFADLDSRLSAVADAASTAGVPVGSILPYAGNPSALPSNWVPCDGRTIAQPMAGLADYDSSTPGLQVPLLNDDRFLMGTSVVNMGVKGGDNTIPDDGAHVHTWNQTGADLVPDGSNFSNGAFMNPAGAHNHGGDRRPRFLGVLYIIRIQ